MITDNAKIKSMGYVEITSSELIPQFLFPLEI